MIDGPTKTAHAIGINNISLEVDDPDALRAALAVRDVEVIRHQNNNFFDPWGNRIEIIEHRGIQFSKTEAVFRAMDRGNIKKTAAAKKELAEKGPG
ncbi:MAG: hypothetical protein OSB69_11080 [Alphaproteobacteria bacterium]|nr:hypothetical protein [Alphaproteobacteria bacterium]